MLLPALSKAREKARAISCTGNLRQLGLAVRMYTDDNEGGLSPWQETTLKPNSTGDQEEGSWRELIYQYVGDKGPYNCGSATKSKYEAVHSEKGHYGMNTYGCTAGTKGTNGTADTSYTNPSSFALLMDCGDDCDDGIWLGVAKGEGDPTFADPAGKTDNSKPENNVHARHSDSVNVTYGDGHAGAKKYTSIPAAGDNEFWNPTHSN